MANDWKEVALGDLVSIKHGYAFKGGEFSEEIKEGPIVVTIGNFDYSGGFRFDSTKIKRTDSIPLSDYILKAEDILLVMTCQTAGGEILGIPGVIPSDDIYLHNQRLGKVEFKTNLLDSKYSYWLFLTKSFNQHLYMTATGTKILHTAPKRIESYVFQLPPIKEQKAIAHILGALNDKIELNRQMNETLEAMAQALFKSWFVDFDPVIDNALAAGNAIPDALQKKAAERAEQRKGIEKKDNSDIQKLFPAEFEFTEEMGWIPKGWKISTLGQESDFSNGYAFKSKELTAESKDAFHVFKMGHIKRGGGFNYDGTKSYFPIADSKNLERYLLKKGDLLMAMTDMKSSMALLGHTALMPENNKFLVNQRVGRLSVKEDATLNYPYIYIYSNLDTTISELRSRANSGVQVNLSTAEIKATNILVPSKSVHDIFDVKAVSFFEKIFLNDQLNRKLAETRDTLLPKLMSGELRIDDL